ncbi:hypothetical protein [Streptomyces sp. NPDC056683]|uniref:hypothetical protein n=1 Tax=Streptomyces sp. NPDC056683 TaxID=3345910 RepID=UPI0036B9D8A8
MRTQRTGAGTDRTRVAVLGTPSEETSASTVPVPAAVVPASVSVPSAPTRGPDRVPLPALEA